MARIDECGVPTRLGDAPPLLPFRKPFDLTPWQFVTAFLTVVLVLGLDTIVSIDDTPFEEGTLISPMLLLRFVVLLCGLLLAMVHPGGRWISTWVWVMFKHWCRGVAAVFPGWSLREELDNPDITSERGATYFPVDAAKMTEMHIDGESLTFIVEPPFWWLMRRTPWAESYWRKHVPYRMLFPVEALGAIALMTDSERASRWHAFTDGCKALAYPVQIVAQKRAEDVDWLLEHTLPPVGSRFAFLRAPIERWCRVRVRTLQQSRIIVVASAPDPDALTEHVKDVTGALTDAALRVRPTTLDGMRAIFDEVFGARRFFPHDLRSFGIDDTDWVTIAIRVFPRSVVVGWIMYVVASLPVDVSLYFEPDDAGWLQFVMDWFDGMCMLPTADTSHRDALADLQRVEGKLKRTEDTVFRTTLLLTMPKAVVPRVSNRLRKMGAVFRELTGEHQQGRFATLPYGGLPRVGVTRPYDGESVAAVHPFGADGLRMPNGVNLGTARTAPECVTFDINDKALYAKMIAMLGTTGAGKTFLMQMLIVRSGLPFTLIDMKPHLSKKRHGDYWPLLNACGGDYIVVQPNEPIEFVDSDAVCYNLANLDKRQQSAALLDIATHEWARQLDALTPHIFGIDEANVLAKTQGGRDFIERVASQGRNANFVGIFASQEVWDFLKNEQTKKAISMSPVLFALAQEHSEVENIADALVLGESAREELRKFQPSPGDQIAVRHALLRVGRRIVSMSIEACPEEIALYTTDPDDKLARRDVAREEWELVAA